VLFCKFIYLLSRKGAETQRFIKTFEHAGCPSPDCSGISRFLENKALAVAFLNREFSGKRETAPKHHNRYCEQIASLLSQ
jgi:hypothetical protein